VLLLAGILAFFAPPVTSGLTARFRRTPGLVWALPFLLAGVFSAAAAAAGVFRFELALSVLAYCAAPVACAWTARHLAARAWAADFAAVLLLWLPIEFSAGAALVPKPAQGFLHTVAYGIAILLGLSLFLCFREWKDMKYRLPGERRDLWLPLAAFAVTAPVLIAIGIPIGFISPPHLPVVPAGKMAAAVAIIFAGTALPEEILFRSLIQNLLSERLGSGIRPLLLASFIFGCAHLDNGPQPLPNWRYMILATVAGIAYGKVFEKSTTVTSSALLHMMVDWTKHFFF